MNQPAPDEDKKNDSEVANERGHGSFWVNKYAIDLLLKKNATSLEIGAFLAISRHTGRDNCFSSAGVKAIKNCLGISEKRANGVVRSLTEKLSNNNRPILWSKEGYQEHYCQTLEWAKLYPEQLTESLKPLPKKKGTKSQTRFVINNFDVPYESKAWFHNDIVGDRQSEDYPLSNFNRFAFPDTAMRLLLYMHRAYCPDHDWSEPWASAYCKFEKDKEAINNGYRFFRGKRAKEPVIAEDLCLNVPYQENFQNTKKTKETIQSELKECLKVLIENGLLCGVVGVLSDYPGNENATPIVELDYKLGGRKFPKACRLAFAIEPVARMVDFRAARGEAD